MLIRRLSNANSCGDPVYGPFHAVRRRKTAVRMQRYTRRSFLALELSLIADPSTVTHLHQAVEWCDAWACMLCRFMTRHHKTVKSGSCLVYVDEHSNVGLSESSIWIGCSSPVAMIVWSDPADILKTIERDETAAAAGLLG